MQFVYDFKWSCCFVWINPV